MDLADGILHCNGEEMPLQRPGGSSLPRTCRAVLDAAVTLPPYSEGVASARVEGVVQTLGQRWGVLEPARDQEPVGALRGLLVGRRLVDLNSPTGVVRLHNITGQRHKLRKGTEVATCQLVESVQLPGKTEGQSAEVVAVELLAHT